MNPTCTHLRRAAPVLLALLVAGCSSLLHSDAPPVQVYTLRPGASSSSEGAGDPPQAAAASLRVAHPLAGPGLGTAQIVLLQPDHRMNVYAASAWSTDAPALIESLAEQTLRDSGQWSSVEDAESPFPSDYLLQISIRRFDADYSAGTDAAPTIHVTLDCMLGSEDGRRILASFVAAGAVPAAANKLSDVVAAFQQATDQALKSLSQQTAAALRATLTGHSGRRAVPLLRPSRASPLRGRRCAPSKIAPGDFVARGNRAGSR